MADNPLFGLFRSDDDANPVADGPGASSGDAAALALVMGAAGASAQGDPDLAAAAARYLQRQGELVDRQTQLVAIQTEHLHEQRKVTLSQLKVHRTGEVIRTLLQGLAVVAAVVVLSLVGLTLWQAAQSRALVIEAFSVPPDLAAQGLTGQAVAGQIQDRLTQFDAASGSARAAASYQNASANEIRIEIPHTGVTLGDLDRFLRDQLGHDTHISGEIYHSGAALSLNVRAGGVGGGVITGDPAHVDDLIGNAAEEIYKRTQPYRYAVWLGRVNRRPESTAMLKALTRSASTEDRIWAFAGLNAQTIDAPGSRLYMLQALQIDPKFSHNWFDMTLIDSNMGLEEASLQAARNALKTNAADRGSRITPLASDWERAACQGLIDSELRDLKAAVADMTPMLGKPDYSGMNASFQDNLVDAFAMLHDPAQARAAFDATGREPKDQLWERADMAFYAGDWAQAAQFYEQFRAVPLPPDAERIEPGAWTNLATAYARLGRFDLTDALTAAMPDDCYGCNIARALAADLRHDTARAERLFAQAVAEGPSLPAAHQAWGESRLARGDLAGALVEFQAAARLGRHWADPLKGEGDVAARQGRWRDAAGLYDQALRRAPAWADLTRALSAARAKA
jgi:hypothetical protein